MQIKNIWIIYITAMLLITPILTICASSQDNNLPTWSKDWSFKQEINLPISTYDSHAIFQPIDLYIEFEKPCWVKNQNEHSVRVCCWDGDKWHELESQIYDLELIDQYHIKGCRIVFLVPEIANGEERYFIFYDDNEKSSPNYIKHVNIEDAYYYYEPISGISLEGDYYKIEEDGFGIYSIGQKGRIINRPLSQAIIKMKTGTKEFDISNSDNIASLSFGYNIGVKDEDQIASDYTLVSKEIRVNGNLMVEFGIVSESEGKELRTTNIYKYYYCPSDNKRLSVHVKHKVFNEGIVKGQINSDGLFGGIISYSSKSRTIKRMQFGKILPYIHLSGENNQIKEYILDPNPENKEREWIVPYTDDCDLGEDAWISYDEGEIGKAFGILFESNKDIVKYGKDERDGIQIKSMVKEYLDVLGAEIDYAAVAFGRNSYEKGETHDLNIPDDLEVEFDVELYSTEEGGYKEVITEGEYFKNLVKHRKKDTGDPYYDDQNIYTLTVCARFSGGVFTLPTLSNLTGISILNISAELYQCNEIISKGIISRPLIGSLIIKFPKVATGYYIVKIYRQIGNRDKRIIGIKAVNIEEDKFINVYCTWQKSIQIITNDQYGKRIEGIKLDLIQNDKILLCNITEKNNDTIMYVNYNPLNPYFLKAYYKGFIVYNEQILGRQKNVNINLKLYDLTIDVKDKLGFNPGINVRPLLISYIMDNPTELIPENVKDGKYEFKNLYPSKYKLYISYGRFSDEKYIDVPEDGDSANIKFSAVFNLKTNLLDSRGNQIVDKDLKLDIIRNGRILFNSISPDKAVTIPPAKYTIKVYSNGEITGEKTVELSNDKNINIVTNLKSIIPTLVNGIIFIFIIEIIILILFKKISLNTFLKLLALALIVISLFQPWWSFNGYSDKFSAEKTSEMFIIPQTMIESVKYDEETYLELSTLPKMFTDFVGTLLFIVYSGIFLLAFSFIPNILLKRRFFIILISASILFLTLVALAFSFGMAKIAEISLGSLNGEATLDIILPNGNTVNMLSTWGLGSGFYLCIFSALLLIATGIIDFIRKKEWPKRIFLKKLVNT